MPTCSVHVKCGYLKLIQNHKLILLILLTELVGAIIVMLILAILYEGLKTLRVALITLEKKMTRSGRDDEMKQLLPGAE